MPSGHHDSGAASRSRTWLHDDLDVAPEQHEESDEPVREPRAFGFPECRWSLTRERLATKSAFSWIWAEAVTGGVEWRRGWDSKLVEVLKTNNL
jgi:hypothetical protein